jgi:K(+)-stimulated pyrophosphate-energized sodium pump
MKDLIEIPFLWWVAPIASILALLFAFLFYSAMMKKDEGTDKMKEIAQYIREGAMAYLKQQYKVVFLFFIIATVLLSIMSYGLEVQNKFIPIAFITGGFFSGLAGFLGMKTATNASARTAWAAKSSLNQGLQVSFRAGAVMGLVVVGLGLLYISIWFLFLKVLSPIFGVTMDNTTISIIMLTFGMGASFQALFARVGGGIFTKAADVGADLVGKVEACIPEDDPRNPATIADNVGDNVGDVAGMGADLYESYSGSILAAMALGVAAFRNSAFELNSFLLPMIIAGLGIIFSIIGIFFVKTKENANQKELLKSLNYGIIISSILIIISSAFLVNILLPNNFGIFWSIITGLLAGIIIGQGTEYFTSHDYKPTIKIAESAQTGPATLIISGVATGMNSTLIPTITISVGTLFAYGFSGGFTSPSLGLYGVGIAAVGMLSTLGITLATDAYGPIADNAGGNAQMSGLGSEVRKRTDALDSLGNTTAATGKGFAIGSAALTALALLAAYIEEIRNIGENIIINGISVDVATAELSDIMNYYQVHLLNPKVIVGLFIGGMLAFVFSAMTMSAVGRAAEAMVNEVRRQFKEIAGIMEGTGKPDYASCVDISTKGAQKEMILPSLLAFLVPITVGLILGVPGVIGMLTGGLSTGFLLAIMLNNSGGAWDNAKKYIETGKLGGKCSDSHKAAVIGDTVGDPFKDTAGPSLNILIKLITIVSIVFAGFTFKFSPIIAKFLGIS